MGTERRDRPAHLAEKLYKIREALNLTQNEMLDFLGLKGSYDRAYISQWETDLREPTLGVLLKYARAYGVIVDVLIDDELDLPSRRPSKKRTGSSQNDLSNSQNKSPGTNRRVKR